MTVSMAKDLKSHNWVVKQNPMFALQVYWLIKRLLEYNTKITG